ncbi:hypothetical protein SAMN05519103_06354 [Rhizobiales bacterium GAS113]|nr:hypothetical protein SAMN05519103_06354 [Rhizobiales bacterium GAS113]
MGPIELAAINPTNLHDQERLGGFEAMPTSRET